MILVWIDLHRNTTLITYHESINDSFELPFRVLLGSNLFLDYAWPAYNVCKLTSKWNIL